MTYVPSQGGAVPARWRRALHAAVIAIGLASASILALPDAALGAPAAASSRHTKAQKKGRKPTPRPRKGDSKKKSAKGHARAAPPAPPAPPAAKPIALDLSIQRVTLDNGLRVVLNVDHASPTVAVAVTYGLGARDDKPGQSGLAALFERLMFEGSKNLDRGDHARLVAQRGGFIEHRVGADAAVFAEAPPARDLALALWLEADRMKSLALDEANFDAQRRLLLDTTRARLAETTYATSRSRLDELVYQGYYPYEHGALAMEAELGAVPFGDARDFYARLAAPSNAALTIAGDFDAEEALRLVHRYFDDAPKREAPVFTDVPFPEQTSQRTAVIRDDIARAPQVLYGWAIPPRGSEDHLALELAAAILGDGESARLHHLLVRDKAFARSVSARTANRRGPDRFSIDIELVEGAKVGDVEKIVEAEMKSLTATGPSEAELDKARLRAGIGLARELQSNLGRARRLGEYELSFGDASKLATEPARYFEVTRDDIKRAVEKHLGPTRRTIIEAYPTAALAPPPPKKAAPAVKAAGPSKKAGAKARPGHGKKTKR